MQRIVPAVTRTCLALFISAVAWAQQDASPLAFEVASIKPSSPTGNGMMHFGYGGGPGSSDPGRITADNLGLRDLIVQAYSLKSYQLNAPDWMDSTRFDIVAKVPAGATKEQVLVMWQNLLAERFKLVIHRETKELPVYALIVGKGGSKMAEAAPDDPAATSGTGAASASMAFSTTVSMSGGQPPPSIAISGMAPASTAISTGRGRRRMSSSRMTMSNLADSLTRNVDRPVLDETGLKGRYKVSLEWQPEDLSTSAPEGATGPTIFAAVQEQLGLKLEPRKGSVELLVIDHADKTLTEN